MQTEIEAKTEYPCPFCGNKPKIYIRDDGKCGILCDSDDCYMSVEHSDWFFSASEAIAEWDYAMKNMWEGQRRKRTSTAWARILSSGSSPAICPPAMTEDLAPSGYEPCARDEAEEYRCRHKKYSKKRSRWFTLHRDHIEDSAYEYEYRKRTGA
jgi:hypothetical protein